MLDTHIAFVVLPVCLAAAFSLAGELAGMQADPSFHGRCSRALFRAYIHTYLVGLLQMPASLAPVSLLRVVFAAIVEICCSSSNRLLAG